MRPDDGTRDPSRAASVAFAVDLVSAVVIAALGVIAVSTARDYGISWDEPFHRVYGDYVLDWFLSGGADRSALSYRVDYLYGGGFDLWAAVARRTWLARLPPYDALHLVGALVGVLGLVGTWRLARRLGGPFAGLAATVMLATTPVFYGHTFNNPKDAPFAVGYVWALDALCAVALTLPSVPPRTWAALAITAGLAMSVRIGGLLVLCYLVALVFALAGARALAARRLETGVRLLLRLARPVILVIAGAWVVMLSAWPWALLDPLRRPFFALMKMSRFTFHERWMPFAGEQMKTTHPRWDYLIHYFGLKLPLLVLGLAAIGAVLAVVALRRRRWRIATPRARALAVLAMAIVLPPVYAVATRAILYDGLRHFLFLVPPLCVVAALAAVALPAAVGGKKIVTASIVGLGIAGLSGRVASDMVTLHPYQYVYFNQLAGGLPGAFGRYDTDYYGVSYKEAFDDLAEYLWRDDPDAYLDKTYVLHGCIPDPIAEEYLPPSFMWKNAEMWRRRPGERHLRPDFFLGYTRSNCHNEYPNDPVLLKVERFGTLLTVVRDRRLARKHPGQADPD